MAATSFQDQNLVWQKVFQALAGQAQSGVSGAANPASHNAFRALKLQMATQKGNPQLQFFPFGEADVDAATGFAGPTGAFTLYGAWGKKSGTGTTKAFLEFRNGISGGAAASGVLVSMRFSGPGDEAEYISPSGLPFGQTTGSLVFSVTAINGTTATTGDSDSQHGFLVIGA